MGRSASFDIATAPRLSFADTPPAALASLPPSTSSLASLSSRWLPAPLRKHYLWVVAWLRGPQPPKQYRVTPVLERLQTAPNTFIHRILPQKLQRAGLLFGYYFIWLLSFVAVLHNSTTGISIGEYGHPVVLSCLSTFWPDPSSCGVDGQYCRPFDRDQFAFRCPASCKETRVLNPYTVGDEEIIYRTLVVGGPTDSETVDSTVYRGDSFLCSAAVHAGVVSNSKGGCGVISLIGEATNYPSVDSHGISSVGFNSSFPLSFTFPQGDAEMLSQCSDPRWRLLAISVVFTVILSIFTLSPAIFYASVFVCVYFQVALASDPPVLPLYSAVSTALGRFLPAAFVALAMYRYCIRRTLHGLKAPIERTVLWVGGCWVGALSNYTFEEIPIQRLTAHDLNQQPGAIVALVIIIIVIVAVALTQAWVFRAEGRLPRFLGIYALIIVVLLLLLAVPGEDLRIHHYIVGLALLPGTAIQTRPSLLYQGVLVGLFINGVARWDFASILQTPTSLLGDAQVGSLLPEILAPNITGNNSATFFWKTISEGWDGITILVNDVERYLEFQDEATNFTWTRLRDGLDEYVRFGYVKFAHLGGLWFGDYTKAGIWKANGTWITMPDGAT